MQHVLVIGGTSGIGRAVAELLLDSGFRVTVAARHPAPSLRAAGGLSGPPAFARADIADEAQVSRLLAETAPLDHVVVTAADAAGAVQPLAGFPLAAARAVVDTKLLGPWLVAKHAAAHLGAGSSITFTGGFSAYRPGPGASVTAAVNGAVEAMTRALALELAPVRVNAISPGWTDTPLWDTIAGADRQARLAELAERVPLRRVGRPADVAAAYLALIGNAHITGALLHVDGGQRLG